MTGSPDPAGNPSAGNPSADATGVWFPPEPWELRGRGALSAWLVATDRLPTLPPGARPVGARGRALALTAFVAYDEGGLLPYRELLAGVVVRHGGRAGPGLPALTITGIWVDSEASLAGGRAHWAIPKEMARFTGGTSGGRTDESARALTGPGPGHVATARFGPARLAGRRLPALPLPFPLPGRVVQAEDGAAVTSRVRASGRVRPAAASWDFRADGALGWLAGARPARHLLAEEFAMRFGPRLP